MRARTLAWAEIDSCPECGGAFFDPGEAVAVHSASAEPGWLIADGRAKKQGPSALSCPAHPEGVLMDAYLVGEGERVVEIDYCHTCGGAFLDIGEGGQLTDAVLSMGDRAEVEGRSGARFAAPPGSNAEQAIDETRAREGKGVFGELMRGVLDIALRHERDKRIIARSGGPTGPFSPYDD